MNTEVEKRPVSEEVWTALCSPVGAFITGISKMAALLEIIV